MVRKHSVSQDFCCSSVCKILVSYNQWHLLVLMKYSFKRLKDNVFIMLRVERTFLKKTTKLRSHKRLYNSINKVKKQKTDLEEIFAKHLT